MSLKTLLHKMVLSTTGNEIKNSGIDYFVAKLQKGIPFSFSRFGDGEWSAILGDSGENCDGHRYFPELGRDLGTALINKQDYLYGMQYRAVKNLGWGIFKYVRRNRIHMQWHDADVFHYCDNAGTLFPLVRQLRTMRVVVIGPSHLRRLTENVFTYDHFIEVPPKNCYLEKNRIRDEVKAYYEKNGPALFSFSASMTTNVIIHELFPLMGPTCWLLDLGSLWDSYVGVDSRGGKSPLYWKVLQKQNIGERP
jgi:hypothetical protein